MTGPYDPDRLPPPPWRTERLILRPYRPGEAELAHAALDCDEPVGRHDPGSARTLPERRVTLARYDAIRAQFGVAPAAAFIAGPGGAEGAFIGQGGLNPHLFDHRDGSRAVEFEVMFKLALPFWGEGYATEIARFWRDFAFAELRLPRLLTCPAKANLRSLAVLERLGATVEPDWLDDDSVIAELRPRPGCRRHQGN